ncbi:unannotated protein [freshwater metagenome]|uniref:Unannotated protein n=1 Tax=freshwater metagenome TaxID=449393 RepID=A0A6J6IET5_9ZZZZ|nr:hypothetical protein [Actinomycetota bacterium]
MGKLSNSISLAKESFGVLKQDKELAAIPLVSAITCGVVALAVGGGMLLTVDQISDPVPGQDDFAATPATWVVGIVGLFILGMIAQFFAATLVAGANERLEGGNPTLRSAVSKASTRVAPVLGWAAINSTVGVVLNAIRDKAGFIGDIVVGMIGAAWGVVTWLVLPIIIVEGIGPIAAVKRSAILLKSTWGENLFAQMGLGLVGFLIMLPGILVFGAVSFAIPLAGIPLLIIWVAVIGSIMSALSAIYRTALYRFAVGLPTGEAFSNAELVGAFAIKKSSSKK